MPIDAGIFSQIQQPQAINPLASLAQAYQIKGQQALLDKNDRENTQQNKLLELVGGAQFQGMDTAGKASALQGIGAFDKAGALITSDAAAGKDRRESAKTDLDMAIRRHEAVGGTLMQLSKDPTQAPQMLKALVDGGIMDSSYAQKVLQSASSAPNPQQFFAMGAQAAVSAKDQLAQQLQRDTFGETNRHNLATEGNAAGTLANSRDRLAFEQNQPQGQVVQGDSGTMLVDRRTARATPVVGPDGEPLQKPGKEIPAGVNKSIIENQQNISKIDRAMAAIDAKPSALGPLNAIPGAEMVRQYTDPEGVNARAGVADIGSLILHDRSGAAVTASETPRLKPFIPTASDSPKIAKEKLARFKEIYEEEAGLLAQTYGKDQGYKENPVLKAGQAARSTATPSGVVAVTDAASYAKVPSGATYTTPDGKTRRKP